MYNDSYNEYIRSVLGSPEQYTDYDYDNNYNYYETRNNTQIEDCYPEIYNIVYPMVQKRCQNITEPVTKDEVEKMVEELYGSLEGNDDINVNITVNNNIDKLNSIQLEQNRTEDKKSNDTEIKPRTNYRQQPNRSTGLFRPNVEPKREEPLPPRVDSNTEFRNKQEDRNVLKEAIQEPKETRFCNNGLCDIIRILLVRELIGGPNRPGWPGNQRPPFPPPGRPGNRPPFFPYYYGR